MATVRRRASMVEVLTVVVYSKFDIPRYGKFDCGLTLENLCQAQLE